MSSHALDCLPSPENQLRVLPSLEEGGKKASSLKFDSISSSDQRRRWVTRIFLVFSARFSRCVIIESWQSSINYAPREPSASIAQFRCAVVFQARSHNPNPISRQRAITRSAISDKFRSGFYGSTLEKPLTRSLTCPRTTFNECLIFIAQ